MLTIGQAMRDARIKAGLKQKELANLAGVHHNTLGSYEQDYGGSPSLFNVIDLADALGLTLDEYVGRTPPPRSEGGRE